MKAVIFLGPSLPLPEARDLFDATFLPPVAEGDVYRAAQRRPKAIGLIDGYFEAIPAVWHKEILYALSCGIHVFGASSMGALRAAELAAFGMEGVGRIFGAYRDGELEDDDEVAVLHGPAELGYPSLSEAMINVRCTLAAACQAGVIAKDSRAALEALAKGLHYRERTYENIVAEGRMAGLSVADLRQLEEWLPHGAVDQKRADAREMLTIMRKRSVACF